MNKLKLSITLSLLLATTLGSTQAFAENINVSIGKIDQGTEIIVPHFGETVDHEYKCRHADEAVFIRTKGTKIQPACVNYGSLDSTVTPFGKEITFITYDVNYKDVVLDLDKKKIR